MALVMAGLTLAAGLVAFALRPGVGSGRTVSNEERAVLHVARVGRLAVLRRQPRTVCKLLTARARRNSLKLQDLNTDPEGQRRPSPKTCVTAVRYQIRDAATLGELGVLRHQRSLQGFVVVTIARKRAHVRLGTNTELYFLRTRHGWRGDFANFSPFDGSSGE
jgi:hypothetical protein